jgi:hypothetical protein
MATATCEKVQIATLLLNGNSKAAEEAEALKQIFLHCKSRALTCQARFRPSHAVDKES